MLHRRFPISVKVSAKAAQRVALGVLLVVCTSSQLFAQQPENLFEEALPFARSHNYAKAFPLLFKAAEASHAQAQFNLGYMFKYGKYVPQNDSMALHWWHLAAELGLKDAQMTLFQHYAEHGEPEQAMDWLAGAAASGDFEAKYLVVRLYMDGSLVESDINKAVSAARHLAFEAEPQSEEDSAYVAIVRCQLPMVLYKEKSAENDELTTEDLLDIYTWFVCCNEEKHRLPFMRQNEYIYTIQQMEYDITQNLKEKALAQAEKWLGHPLSNLEKMGVMEGTTPEE